MVQSLLRARRNQEVNPVPQRSLWTLALVVVMAGDGNAKCLHVPNLRADVYIESCLSVRFGASAAHRKVAEDLLEPMYERGSSLSGTFLSVVVKESHFFWPAGAAHDTNGSHPWMKRERRSLFVERPPDQVCPTAIAEPIAIETESLCCDTTPQADMCLLPDTVDRVSVVLTGGQDMARLTEVKRLTDFPEAVQTLANDSFMKERFDFTPTQFLVGGFSSSSALIAYKQGGRVESYHAQSYVLLNSRWAPEKHWRLWARVTSLSDLLSAIAAAAQ